MTITNGYCTLAEFKAYVTVRGGTISTDAGDDAVIEDIIEAVSRRIDLLSGRVFGKESADSTRYYQPEDGEVCEIDDLSAAPTSVSIDYEADRTYTAITASTEFEMEPVNALVIGWPYTKIYIVPDSGEYFPTHRRAVKVVGKFGWPAVPDDIKIACEEIAHNVWMSRQGQTSGGKITLTAGGVVIRPEDIPAGAMANITAYRKMV